MFVNMCMNVSLMIVKKCRYKASSGNAPLDVVLKQRQKKHKIEEFDFLSIFYFINKNFPKFANWLKKKQKK